MRAVFVDRDGVINENRAEHVTDLEAFQFLDGALEALDILAGWPFAVVVITNQASIGRGQMKPGTLQKIHARMLEQVRSAGGRIDAIYVCPHSPEDRCSCRKPRAALLRRAALDLGLNLRASYFVGDAASDVRAGLTAGCQPILVRTGRGTEAAAELARDGIHGYWQADDLFQAVLTILGDERAHVDVRPAAAIPFNAVARSGQHGTAAPRRFDADERVTVGWPRRARASMSGAARIRAPSGSAYTRRHPAAPARHDDTSPLSGQAGAASAWPEMTGIDVGSDVGRAPEARS